MTQSLERKKTVETHNQTVGEGRGRQGVRARQRGGGVWLLEGKHLGLATYTYPKGIEEVSNYNQ